MEARAGRADTENSLPAGQAAQGEVDAGSRKSACAPVHDRPAPVGHQAGGRDVSDALDRNPIDCEHGWQTESRHRISTGIIVYVRCARCGARRVDQLRGASVVPAAVSRAVSGDSRA